MAEHLKTDIYCSILMMHVFLFLKCVWPSPTFSSLTNAAFMISIFLFYFYFFFDDFMISIFNLSDHLTVFFILPQFIFNKLMLYHALKKHREGSDYLLPCVSVFV